MLQADKANRFKALHRKGDPIVLFNIWDAGGAKAVADAGAKAIATGSWSVAAAHGFDDGESIPLDFVVEIVTRIVDTVNLPVTVDFEGGYAVDPAHVSANVLRLIQAGVVGINFEDRVVQGDGLHPVSLQVERIKSIRDVARDQNIPLFVNARTDLFLGTDPGSHEDRVNEAIERQAAYAEAGADGFFVPGLTNTSLIEQIVEVSELPVNVMMTGDLQSVAVAASLGVSRVSFGPAPFLAAMSDLAKRAMASIRA